MDSNSALDFVHLHVHTAYSLLDGLAKIDDIISRTKELGMNSIAITDHGSMYGVIEFYKKAKSAGIKPIIGCEVYVANDSRFKKEGKGSNSHHLILLAETIEGYHNLVKLVSCGFTEGFHYKPRIDKELLRQHSKGLICCSACIAGEVARKILDYSYEEAKEVALEFLDIFGEGNFFLEIQDHGIHLQKQVNAELERMSKETGIPLVATNDSHYIQETDAEPHDILLCIQTGKTISMENRMRYHGNQFYIKSAEEMQRLFPHLPEALANTQKIADRCNVEIKFHEPKLPEYDVPDGKEANQYLREICYQNFNEKYPNATEELEQRLEYELKTIEDMGFVDYFLIVWDFIKYAKDNDIVVGPGRGSAAGSMIAYCLSITTIDPIEYDLIFERFLNPERVSMPDIDIDFCYERRQEVIDYVVRKYGDTNVAQIITFMTLAAKAAIRDVGRVLEIPLPTVDKIAKLIPKELDMTIEKALADVKELKDIYETDEEIHKLIEASIKLQGMPRNSSTHAAGVVICKEPVMEYVPLSKLGTQINTQYNMTILEELGLLKMDFLGLRTLTIIQSAVREINRIHDISLNIDDINLEDSKVYKMIGQGKTEGVFQLESAGMKSFMKELQPENLEDLIAGISLYRPGPMDFIPKYVEGKNDRGSIRYEHEKLEPILSKTYGCIVYQEQVMEIVRVLAGYSLGRSDLLRRAMSKKKAEVMAMERKNFVYGIEGEVAGCEKNGIPPEVAEAIFDKMVDFAKYAFNKSHAACYALIGYQTAWLKTHYPVEFMSALMTSCIIGNDKDRIIGYLNDCKTMNIEVLPPNINEGYSHFSVASGKIYFALNAVKKVGKSAIDQIVKEREKNGNFKSISDLCSRMGQGVINKSLVENLIRAGAFDCFGGFRRQYMLAYPDILSSIANTKKNNIEGQMSLFDVGVADDDEVRTDKLPNVSEFPKKEKLSMEKEVIGIYTSGHPLSDYEKTIANKVSHSTIDFIRNDEYNDVEEMGKIVEQDEVLESGTKVIVGGIISKVDIRQTKYKDKMAEVTLEDFYGTVRLLVFPKVYKIFQNKLVVDNVVVVSGQVNIEYDQSIKIFMNDLKEVASDNEMDKKVWLKLPIGTYVTIDNILPVIYENRGDIPVVIYDEAKNIRMESDSGSWVSGSDRCLASLRFLLGNENVIMK